MALTQPSTTTMPHYPEQFRRIILTSARLLLDEVRANNAPMRRGDEEQALHTLSYSLGLFEAWPIVRTILLTLAPRMEQAGFRDEWIPYLEKGIVQSRRQSDSQAEAELRLQLGILLRLRGKYAQAHEQLGKSAKIFSRLERGNDQAKAMNQIAYLYRLQREFSKARECVNNALMLLPKESTERARSHLILGTIDLDCQNYEAAVAIFEETQMLLEEKNEPSLLGRCLLNYGATLRQLGKYQEAIDLYNKAYKIFKQNNDPVHIAHVQTNLGNVYLKLKAPQKALGYYQAVKTTFTQTQEQLGLAHVEHNIAMAYRQLQKWEEAEKMFVSSIDRYCILGNVERVGNGMEGLGKLYAAQQRFELAKQRFEEAIELLAPIQGQPGIDKLSQSILQNLSDANQHLNDNLSGR